MSRYSIAAFLAIIVWVAVLLLGQIGTKFIRLLPNPVKQLSAFMILSPVAVQHLELTFSRKFLHESHGQH